MISDASFTSAGRFMPTPEVPLDPADFIIIPNVFVLDEFDMTDDEGNVVARVDAQFIARIVKRMIEREETTGDLCPIVIGHTAENPQGDEEVNGPPLVGYLRNWKQLPFFDTGKTAAAPDAWILKSEVDRVRRFPRRSSEVWLNKYEIDPVSFLGATTPARDLGLLRLNRGGDSVVRRHLDGCIFDCSVRLSRTTPTNRDSENTEMADDNKTKDDDKKKADDKPKADPAQSGETKGVEGKLDALTQMIQQLTDVVSKALGVGGAAGADAGAAAAAPGADADAGGDDGALGDDELDKYLAALGDGGMEGGDEGAAGASGGGDDEDDKSRKGDMKVQNSATYPGGDNTNIPARLQRIEEENEVLRVKLARSEIKEQLRQAVEQDNAALDPGDEKLISDLIILPPDARTNMILRLSRQKSKAGSERQGHAGAAHANATQGGKKRVSTQDEKREVAKLARQKNVSFEIAAAELGYTIG